MSYLSENFNLNVFPMSTDGIVAIERNNDTSTVNLFYSGTSPVWIAYGYSAYSLRLLIKSRSFYANCMRGYSSELGLPYTIVSTDSLKHLKNEYLNEVQLSQTEVILKDLPPFEREDYEKWTNKLKAESERERLVFSIVTPVSQFVPKDKFIMDGMSSFSRNVKRLFDMFSSMIALIVFSPLFLICFIAIKMDDGGPAIFKQVRIGRFGRPFNIYKFRSMRLDAEKKGPQLSHESGKNDPRLTKVGAFLRAHHLDELPQLWNVFCGDMAFVGPRPERKFYIDQILEYDKRYEYLYQIRPGVTSYATFYNGYTDTMEKMLRRLEYDLYYLGHRSWVFDIKILWMTFWGIVSGKKF